MDWQQSAWARQFKDRPGFAVQVFPIDTPTHPARQLLAAARLAEELGLDRLSTEGAAERSKLIAPDIAAPLIAAVVKTTALVQIETIEPMIANKAAFRAALDELRVMQVKAAAAER